MAQAPYQVTNIVFNKGERFAFGSKKQHAVNNMYFFEAAVRAENSVLKLPKEIQDKPHQWDYASMIKGSKAAEERRKMPRGMTARPDPVVHNKLLQLENMLKGEHQRRQVMAPHYMEFLRLFDGVEAGSVHDDFEPIPLSSKAKARRAKVAARKALRVERLRELKTQYGSAPKNTQHIAAKAALLRGPKMTAIQAQIIRAKRNGQSLPTKGIMSTTASRGLLE